MELSQLHSHHLVPETAPRKSSGNAESLNSIGGSLKEAASHSEEPSTNNSLLARGEVRVEEEAMDSDSPGLDPQLSVTHGAPSGIRVGSSEYVGLRAWNVPASPTATSGIQVPPEDLLDYQLPVTHSATSGIRVKSLQSLGLRAWNASVTPAAYSGILVPPGGLLDRQLPVTRAAPSDIQVPHEGVLTQFPISRSAASGVRRVKSLKCLGLIEWYDWATPASPSMIAVPPAGLPDHQLPVTCAEPSGIGVDSEGFLDPPRPQLPCTRAAYRETAAAKTRTEHPSAPPALQAPLQSLLMNGSASCLSVKVKADTSDFEDDSQHDQENSRLKKAKVKEETCDSEDDCQEDGVLQVKEEDTIDDHCSELPSCSVNLAGRKQYKTKRVRLPCGECAKSFKTEKQLRRHMKLFHNPNNVCTCLVCGMRFSREPTLVKHMRIHSKRWPAFKDMGTGTFPCGECDKSFCSGMQLFQHTRDVHSPNNVHRCLECRKVFPKQSSLMKHMRIHSKQRLYACKCRADFQTVKSLRKHAVKCSRKAKWGSKGSVRYSCGLCGKGFHKIMSLDKHILEVCFPMPPLE